MSNRPKGQSRGRAETSGPSAVPEPPSPQAADEAVSNPLTAGPTDDAHEPYRWKARMTSGDTRDFTASRATLLAAMKAGWLELPSGTLLVVGSVEVFERN